MAAWDRHEKYSQISAKCSGDSLEHGKRVALVVRILESANDRCGRLHLCRKLALTEMCPLSKIVDLGCDVRRRELFLKGHGQFGIVSDIPVIGELNRL